MHLVPMWCQHGSMDTADKPSRERLNLRLPPDLKEQLQTYADTMGIPLNTAAILALRNSMPYLLSKAQPQPTRAKLPPQGRPPAKPKQEEWPSQVVRQQAKVGRNDPCPCGSGRKAKQCHPEYT